MKQGVAEGSNLSNIRLNLTEPQAAILLEVILGSYESKSHKEYIRPITAQLISQGITAGYDKKTLKKYGPDQQVVAEAGGNILDRQLKDIDPVDHGDAEGSFVKNQIHTMLRVLKHLENAIGDQEDLPEWVEMKISQAQGMVVGVMDYMISDKEREVERQTGQDALMKEEFDLIESIIENLAKHNGVDAEVIWEDLESLTDDELYVFATTTTIMETEAWQKANKKDKTDGMSKKAVKSYRREHPGSKLQTAVTTKPSKLKKGSKASKRRSSYCSRSKGQMKMHNISCAKTPDKAICKARRRWHCEGVENLDAMLAEAIEKGGDLQPGQYYIWTVYFDDGSKKRIKVTKENFDPKAYYAKKNQVVINTDYDWTVHDG
jgi:hypothetical protein